MIFCGDGIGLEKSGSLTSQLVANDSLESHAAVSLDGEMKSEIYKKSNENSMELKQGRDDSRLDYRAQKIEAKWEEETTTSQPSEEFRDEERHMEWCNWPYTLVEETTEGKQASNSGREGKREGKMKKWKRHTMTKDKSKSKFKLKGGTKKNSEVLWAKVNEIKKGWAKKKLRTQPLIKIESARERTKVKKSVQEEDRRIGLKNLTNTCYLNAAIQGLQSCTLLRDAITKAPARDWEKSRLTRRMKVLFLEMTNSDRLEPWAPDELFKEVCTWEKCAKFKNKDQQDAGELITCLIEKLSEENKTAGKLFSDAQLNTTRCKICKVETAVEQMYQTIALNIDGIESNSPAGEKREKTIEDLLRRYSEWEPLTKDNEYECLTCEKHQDAHRQTKFVYGPNILVMQLKRFSWKEEKGITTVSKLSTRVNFQEDLSLPCQLSSVGVHANYKLKAVIEHNGKTATSGHYLAYVREGNQWTEWNDETGRLVTWATVKNSEAYVLFWERTEEEGAQRWDEVGQTETESMEQMEDEGEEGGTTLVSVEPGNENIKMDIEVLDGQKQSHIGNKRRLESSESSNSNRLKLVPRVTIKRQKRWGEDLKVNMEETLEVAKSTSKWDKQPKGREKPLKYNEGETPLIEESCGSCREDEDKSKPKETSRSNGWEEADQDRMPAEGCHALELVVKNLCNEMEYLKRVVSNLKKENNELRLRMTLWERMNKMKDDEIAEWRNGDDREKEAAEGSPTPVFRRTGDSNITGPSLKKKKEQEVYGLNEKTENKAGKNIASANQPRGERMQIDDMSEDGNEPPARNRTRWKVERRKSGRIEIPELPHRGFLEDCFKRQIGLPINGRQTKNIYSFTNKLVAKGYTKVVTTYQGMYYVMEREQVNWGMFKDRKITIDGDWCWRSEGVTVYNPSRNLPNRTIVPHRFAIKPIQNTNRCSLRTDRYYIHVYQTKVGSSRRTLSSKGIAEELRTRFGGVYMPREIDKQKSSRRWDTRRKTGDAEPPKNRSTGRENWRKNERKMDTWRVMCAEDEDRKRRPMPQSKDNTGRTNWNLRGDDQRRSTNRLREHTRLREHNWGEKAVETNRIEFHKLGEKLDKLTMTLDKLVQEKLKEKKDF